MPEAYYRQVMAYLLLHPGVYPSNTCVRLVEEDEVDILSLERSGLHNPRMEWRHVCPHIRETLQMRAQPHRTYARPRT